MNKPLNFRGVGDLVLLKAGVGLGLAWRRPPPEKSHRHSRTIRTYAGYCNTYCTVTDELLMIDNLKQ